MLGSRESETWGFRFQRTKHLGITTLLMLLRSPRWLAAGWDSKPPEGYCRRARTDPLLPLETPPWMSPWRPETTGDVKTSSHQVITKA